MQRRHRNYLIVFLTAILLAASTRAATVAPHAMFLSHENRSGVFYVHNPSDVALEIDIDLQFGYPASDDNGRVRVVLFENPHPQDPSNSHQFLTKLRSTKQIEACRNWARTMFCHTE